MYSVKTRKKKHKKHSILKTKIRLIDLTPSQQYCRHFVPTTNLILSETTKTIISKFNVDLNILHWILILIVFKDAVKSYMLKNTEQISYCFSTMI